MTLYSCMRAIDLIYKPDKIHPLNAWPPGYLPSKRLLSLYSALISVSIGLLGLAFQINNIRSWLGGWQRQITNTLFKWTVNFGSFSKYPPNNAVKQRNDKNLLCKIDKMHILKCYEKQKQKKMELKRIRNLCSKNNTIQSVRIRWGPSFHNIYIL